MGLQEILDKLLEAKKGNFETTQKDHRIANYSINGLKPLEFTPRKESLQYFVEEWERNGNLYSLDEKGLIMVAHIDDNYLVNNGNQRLLFYQINNIIDKCVN